jgi:large subunit ribosomal protein L15
MRLHNIVSSEGATHPTKRLGRGHGSGHGKTSGRGHKGQKARAGHSQRPGFESGHVPLYRKLPKRGFNNKDFKTNYEVVNLRDLALLPEEVTEIRRELLEKAGLVRRNRLPLKILADGELNRALTVYAEKFSKTAVAALEKAGGKAILTAAAQPEEASEKTESSEATS